MHRLCGTRKRKESSAVGWFGSINYLTKPPPAHRPPPSTSRCSADVLAPKHRPLYVSVYVFIPCTIHPSLLSFSLSLPFSFCASTPSTPPVAPGLKFHREHENRNFDRAQCRPRPLGTPVDCTGGMLIQIRNYVSFDEKSCDVTYVCAQRATGVTIGMRLRNRPMVKLKAKKTPVLKSSKLDI